MISIITVNYNGFEVTCAMLESLKAHVHSCEWEVIVVDNASKRDEAAMLRERYPWAKVVRSEENLGFAGGNNLALPYATGEYLYFINNDTEVKTDCLNELCNALDANPRAGMVCPKVYFFDSPLTIQFAGYTDLDGFRMHNRMIGYGCTDDGSFDVPGTTAFPLGAAMMVKREALEDVGPMAECYFLYYEELDWGAAFRRKGWDILYEPGSCIYHKDSLTTGKESPLSTFYLLRGRQIYAYRNFSGFTRIAAILFTRWLAVPKRAFKALLKGNAAVAKAAFKANCGFVKLVKGKQI